jgi:[lysine-biosynthesis-protein LysW]--L-2-aminoadipate ligase
VRIIARIGIVYEILRWEEKALIETASHYDLEIKPIHIHSVYIPIGFDKPSYLDIDIVVQRCISHVVALNSTIALESLGIKVINNSISTAIAMNKLWTLKILSGNGIPIPRTYITLDYGSSIEVAKIIGYPFVLKPVEGSWGRLIALVRDEEELRTLIEHRNYIQNPIYKINMIQQYIKKPNRDIRIFTIGNQVVAAIYRVSNHWITNTARGGVATPAKIDNELEDLAIRTAKAIGGEVLGIDVFEDPEKGYIVNEVNAVPEFKNTVIVTGVPIHKLIIEYVKDQVKR